MLRKYLLAGWLLLLMSYSLDIFSSGTPSSHGVHVHGSAALNVVLDGDRLFIEFDSPALNLAGFEHEPDNEAQRSTLLNVRQTLVSADRLFHFSPTKCIPENIEIEVPFLKIHQENNPHTHHQEAQPDHADFHADYIFHCRQSKGLKTILVKLFVFFPGIQEIRVQWIFHGRQGFALLTAEHPELKVN